MNPVTTWPLSNEVNVHALRVRKMFRDGSYIRKNKSHLILISLNCENSSLNLLTCCAEIEKMPPASNFFLSLIGPLTSPFPVCPSPFSH